MKKFNTLFVLAIGVMTFSTISAQNDSSGIYKTANDFRDRKFSYAINYNTEKNKIKESLFFYGGEIKVKDAGETYTLLKNETYG